jgi:hypothetical protein
MKRPCQHRVAAEGQARRCGTHEFSRNPKMGSGFAYCGIALKCSARAAVSSAVGRRAPHGELVCNANRSARAAKMVPGFACGCHRCPLGAALAFVLLTPRTFAFANNQADGGSFIFDLKLTGAPRGTCPLFAWKQPPAPRTRFYVIKSEESDFSA